MNQNLNRTALIPTLCYDIGNTDILCKGGRTRCPGHIFHIPFQSLMWDKYIDRCRDHIYVQVARRGSILRVKKKMFIKICRSPNLKEFLVYLCSRSARIPRIRVSIGRKWFQWCRVYNDIVRLHRRSRHHMRPLDHRHTLYYSQHQNWCSNSHTDIRDISCLALFVHIDIVQFENRIDLEQILSDGIGKLKEYVK